MRGMCRRTRMAVIVSYDEGMLGAIVGDVIGSPFEFSNVKYTGIRIFEKGAQCADDSILTVATADVLLNKLD
jgi:ADP-ribosyl-[dinitrogen reductase] hydrolase